MILGGIVGLEREYRAKDAGFRTHFLVAIGSALFTLISMYGFADGVKDTSRVAAQVVSGIGFLGAGIIVFQRNVIRGLTTAAGLWVTAAIGMACGVGQFYMAVLVTLLMLIGLEVLNRFIPHIGSSSVQLSFSSPSRKDVAEAIMNIRKIVVDVISYEIKNKESDKGEYYKVQMEVRTKHRQRNDRILEILKDFDNVNIIDVE
jgi:putative Mg2+ transporter-C (MgtC) family protein